MTKVLIHHGEIGLKKGNFPFFEKKLMENIVKSVEKNKLNLKKIQRQEKRIIADIESDEKTIIETLKNVFGIKYFSFVQEISPKIEEMEKIVKEIMEKEVIKKIAFKTKRSDKNFPLNSVEINTKFGEIANQLGIKVDYSNPELTIFTEITSKKIFVYTKKIKGFGGLPVGTSGKVLCLLSGGIDSPVAAWLMMKRGCKVDFLHFHAYKTNKEAYNSKIKKFIEILNKSQNDSKLNLIPYSGYEIFSQGKIPERYDLVMFKHYMIKTAEKFAIENNYDAIVTGDNLGQVASQTIENITASSHGVSILLFRPLLTYDKEEIINLAKIIGTLDLSLEKYKDCCSILSKSPATKTKLEFFKKLLDDFDMGKLIEQTIKEIETFN